MELVGFPGTKYDDQVDSTIQALDHMREDNDLATYLKAFDSAGSSIGATAQKRHCRRKRHPVKRARMPHRGDHRFESLSSTNYC